MVTELAEVKSIEDIAVGLSRSFTHSTESRNVTIQVTWHERFSELSYGLIGANPQDHLGDWPQPISGGDEQIKSLWRRLSNILQEIVTLGNPSEEIWDSAIFTLKAEGRKLFEAFFPNDIQEFIHALPAGFSLGISTNEQWIPWELIYDGEDFLGTKFLVTRYPRIPQANRLNATTKPNPKSSISSNRKKLEEVVNAIGGEIGKAEAEQASQLFDNFNNLARTAVLREQSISILEESLRTADLFHCTCHGRMNPHHFLQISDTRSLVKNLSIDHVGELQIKPGIFVFINACSSDAPEQSINGFSSFGWEFYKKGASLFIGTIGVVPTKYAIDFAEQVYSELFSENNELNVLQAFLKAKQSASEKRNLFWLLYCIYGNPNFWLEIELN
jgi:hypothetical protein